MTRHNARAIVLQSGERVRFELPGGDRHSSKPLEHAQVSALLQEIMSQEQRSSLRTRGRASFRHKAEGGVEVDLQIDASQPGNWTVRMVPASGPAPAESAPQPKATPLGAQKSASSPGQRRAPAEPPEPTSSNQPAPGEVRAAPRVEHVAGEPKINRYLRMMKAVDASDLHLSTGVVPMARIDGAMKALEPGHAPFEAEELRKILLEIAPETNREEFEETYDTDFAHAIEGVARFRANLFEDNKGPGGVFRQIPFEILSVEQIGLPQKVLDLCWLSKGLVLVTGPTGSGKSTTLATLIDFINQNRTDHIITIEDPIEFVHDNKKCLINQREIGTHTQSFKKALRAALREDPDIVLVGEMRDLETIAIAIETAETGHLVFGTLHTTSAPSTVDRIIDQFPADQQEQIRVMLSESLRGVIAQVLCKKQGGGRAAAYEVLIANGAVANLIREGKTFQLKSVMQTGRKLGMQTMNDHLLEHVKAGRVTPEEAYMKSNDKQIMANALKAAGHQLKLTE